MTVGDRIRILRETKNISQEELAKMLGLKDKSSVCKIEKAGDNISTKSINKYAEVLGVTPAYLMGWTDEPFDLQLFADNQNDPERVARAMNLLDRIEKLSPDDQKLFLAFLDRLPSDQ